MGSFFVAFDNDLVAFLVSKNSINRNWVAKIDNAVAGNFLTIEVDLSCLQYLNELGVFECLARA
jgi:hypothetical protein